MAEGAMSAFLTDVASIVTQILTWVSSVTTTIVSSPMLLFTVGFLALGGAIGRICADIKLGKNGKNLEQTIPC